ncbi:hypothetical protein [Spirosoma spitsbergense]|uniref:hypothetical protein n=1 Tax=Spirosoma spitsbergense TaxID=431554 RepID=UPI00037240A6|nr:hypothetical protein [Spirosoma spitsbergense]
MEDEKKDRFSRLIQQVGPDKPGADFTRAIMKQVQAESELDPANEAALIQLLQSHTLVEKPSSAFNRRVMNQILVSQPRQLEPIIRPRVWYVMAASLLLIVLFCVGLLSSSPAQPTSSGLDRFFLGIEGTLDALPISYPLTLFAIGVLVVLDYFMRRDIRVRY